MIDRVSSAKMSDHRMSFACKRMMGISWIRQGAFSGLLMMSLLVVACNKPTTGKEEGSPPSVSREVSIPDDALGRCYSQWRSHALTTDDLILQIRGFRADGADHAETSLILLTQFPSTHGVGDPDTEVFNLLIDLLLSGDNVPDSLSEGFLQIVQEPNRAEMQRDYVFQHFHQAWEWEKNPAMRKKLEDALLVSAREDAATTAATSILSLSKFYLAETQTSPVGEKLTPIGVQDGNHSEQEHSAAGFTREELVRFLLETVENEKRPAEVRMAAIHAALAMEEKSILEPARKVAVKPETPPALRGASIHAIGLFGDEKADSASLEQIASASPQFETAVNSAKTLLQKRSAQ